MIGVVAAVLMIVRTVKLKLRVLVTLAQPTHVGHRQRVRGNPEWIIEGVGTAQIRCPRKERNRFSDRL
jgi:hypothetical protein